METSFGATRAYTVGVEEEFQLVDPTTRELSPASGAMLAADGSGRLASELLGSCVEMLSPVFGTVANLGRELPGLRRAVRELARGCGAVVALAGTHPFSEPTGQPLTAERRHLMVGEEMGWVARTQAIYGLHVHVAVPDGEAAVRATNELARRVPLMVALSANSPFWRGAQTRLASTRIKVFDLFPRSGLPPAFRDWGDFEDLVETLISSGSIPDYSWCWWDARPHPRLGTVELRSLDAQTNPAYAASLAALTQCLVVEAAASPDRREPEDPLLTDENKWRAARHGADALFYDFAAGREVGAREMAHSLVDELRPVSQDLGCEAELLGVLEIVDRGTGAELQRAAFEKTGSLKAVVDRLVEATAPV